MKKRVSPLRKMTEAAFIAALYAAITLVPGINMISYGPFQFRIAEALTILPAITSSAIPGLTLGCVIANSAGVLMGTNIAGWWDVLFGSMATLMAALCTYWLRKVTVGGVPFLCPFPPVLFNGLIVGAELAVALNLPFWVMVGDVALGELAVCYILGLPVYFALRKAKWSGSDNYSL